jgi:hypothetical protein
MRSSNPSLPHRSSRGATNFLFCGGGGGWAYVPAAVSVGRSITEDAALRPGRTEKGWENRPGGRFAAGFAWRGQRRALSGGVSGWQAG